MSGFRSLVKRGVENNKYLCSTWRLRAAILLFKIREVAEPARLLDPVFRGAKVARGDGRLDGGNPGCFGGDLYLEALCVRLRRIGNTPVRSTLALNAGCPRRCAIRFRRRSPIDSSAKGGPIPWAILAASLCMVNRRQDGGRRLPLGGIGLSRWRLSTVSGERAAPRPRTARGRLLRQAGNFPAGRLIPDCNYPACDCSFVQRVWPAPRFPTSHK